LGGGEKRVIVHVKGVTKALKQEKRGRRGKDGRIKIIVSIEKGGK